MANVIDIHDYDTDNSSSISLNDYLASSYNEKEFDDFCVNADAAMKYLHNKGYHICSFNPEHIELVNGDVNLVRFDYLDRLPNDSMEKKEIIKKDISRSVMLQIGIYSNCLNYLKPDFLKNNFSEFSQFLPEDNIPYYRGVVERGASVYLIDYLLEKKKRDYDNLEKELDSSNNTNERGKKLVKSNGIFADYDTMNTGVNDNIYKSLSGGLSDAAFTTLLIIPIILTVIGSIIFLMLTLN